MAAACHAVAYNDTLVDVLCTVIDMNDDATSCFYAQTGHQLVCACRAHHCFAKD